MAEDSEKRFHAIMDKLFFAPPKPKSQSNPTKSASLSGVQLSRGMKRPNMSSALMVVEPKSRGSVAEGSQTSAVPVGAQDPLCRPWDRGDLQKRLATFKSMTWFAKPEVVSAVNCARRGWINVDSDTIACEACGSRLLFSTPSSWTQHQVEKAARVFSLKLDNGHKLFCPWVDNACDEALAQFPPTPAAVLVDNYKKQCVVLLQLAALPVVSSSAIDRMRRPQLDDFLQESSHIEFTNKSDDASTAEYLGHECQAISSTLYYQAHKLISLCGWEPRSLPYFVDYEDRDDSSIKDINISNSPSNISNGHNTCISVYSPGSNEALEANDDPSSVVLDCRLCGASVGLWAFSTTPRPVEFIRLVGEVNGQKSDDNSGTHDGNKNHFEASANTMNTSKAGTSSLHEAPRGLNLTIAGGPPPAKQSFRPTISLPVIGRNLRARFSSDLPEGVDTGEQRIQATDRPESSMKNPLEITPSAAQNSSELCKLPESAAQNSSEPCKPPVAGHSATSTTGGHMAFASGETSLNDNQEDGHGSVARMQPQSNNISRELHFKQPMEHKRMEFDPIRQHRHFCPWITSGGGSPPGWQQTLSALQRQKEFSSPASTNSPSSSLIEVDDPVASVKRLFTSPPPKRAKLAHGSS